MNDKDAAEGGPDVTLNVSTICRINTQGFSGLTSVAFRIAFPVAALVDCKRQSSPLVRGSHACSTQYTSFGKSENAEQAIT